jgi:hypothetical protein
MTKKSTRRSMKKTHRKRSVKRSQRTRRMRGGADSVSAPTTTGNFALPQGLAYFPGSPMGMAMKGGMSKDAYGVYGSEFYGMKPIAPMQQGGSAPYPGSVEGVRLLNPGMESAAGTGRIDGALAAVAGLRDPNQVGGRKRKSKKTRKAKKSRKSKKSTRKTRKAKKSRKSKKSARKTRKAKKSRKGRKAGRKAHRRGRKAQRGGEMDYSESMNGGILPSSLLGKAGLHSSWSDVAAGRMV